MDSRNPLDRHPAHPDPAPPMGGGGFAVLALVLLLPAAVIVLLVVNLFAGGCPGTVECYPGDTRGNPFVPLALVASGFAVVIWPLLCHVAATTRHERRRRLAQIWWVVPAAGVAAGTLGLPSTLVR